MLLLLLRSTNWRHGGAQSWRHVIDRTLLNVVDRTLLQLRVGEDVIAVVLIRFVIGESHVIDSLIYVDRQRRH